MGEDGRESAKLTIGLRFGDKPSLCIGVAAVGGLWSQSLGCRLQAIASPVDSTRQAAKEQEYQG